MNHNMRRIKHVKPALPDGMSDVLKAMSNRCIKCGHVVEGSKAGHYMVCRKCQSASAKATRVKYGSIRGIDPQKEIRDEIAACNKVGHAIRPDLRSKLEDRQIMKDLGLLP
jgi:hypothetical protein